MGSVLSSGDAVTNHIIEIDRRLSAWGFDTCIYGSDISGVRLAKAQPDTAYRQFLDDPEDLLIYHYSAYCGNASLFRRSRNRKLFVYHNITPAEYYQPYDPTYEALCSRGRELLRELAGCDWAVGDSEYNRQELVSAGFAAERTGILPLFLGVSDFERATRDESLYRRLKSGGMSTVLFVGRVAPNKAFEDLIKIFYAYHRHVNSRSRLILAGARFLPAYDRTLDGLVTRLGLDDAVIFTNRISLAELKACYQAAGLFLCASRHEGFCAPLLEAMYFDVPILARAEAAVPYTLGQAGIQFHRPEGAVLAELAAVLLQDERLRRQVVATQQQRLADFQPRRVEASLAAALEAVGIAVPPLPVLE